MICPIETPHTYLKIIKDMDRGVELVQKLQSCIPLPKLLYFVMDDWLLVHRNSFDHFNENGEPFIGQVFLIEIKTGRYIHRCQGRKVDHGTAIDLQVLTAKLTYAFQGTKPCPGFFIQEDDGVDDGDPLSSTTTLDFPFRRRTSRNCQFYFEVPTIKSENNDAGDERCSPCQAVCQEVHSSSKNITDSHFDGSDFALQTDAQSKVVDTLRIKPEDDDGNGPSSPDVSSYNSSEAADQELYSMAKDRFESHNSNGRDNQANLDEKHDLDAIDIKDNVCEDIDAQSKVVDILRIKPENYDVDGPSSRYISSYDSSELVRQEIYSKAKEIFEGHIWNGDEDQAKLDDKPSLGIMDVIDNACEDKQDWRGSLAVVENKDNPHSLNMAKASDEPSSSIFKVRQSSATGTEHVYMCCSQPFPSLQALTWHRNLKRGHTRHLDNSNGKPTVPEVEVSIETTTSIDAPRKTRNRCLCCSIVFPNNRELVKHAVKRQKEERARRKVRCRECKGRRVRTFKQLIRHYSTHHPEKLEKNQEYLPQTQDLETMKKPKTCSICDVVSNGGTMNNRHKESYHVVGNYLCSTCQEPCLTYYDMMIHNFQAHLKATDSIPINYNGLDTYVDEDGKISYKTDGFVCQICSKSFRWNNTFACHQRRAHSWGRMRCKPCGEWSNYSQDISAHTLLFHKDKPEVHCPNCDKMIDLKDNPAAFNNHFPTCAPKRACKRPLNGQFQSQVCGEKYSLKKSLNLKTPQGIFKYQCQYCGFGANLKQTIVQHKKSHLGKEGSLTEKPKLCGCEVCGKVFANKKAVYNHMRNVHREQKPVFQCKKCGQLLKNSSALTNHKVKVHGHVPQSKRSK
ncbi:zinc finger protein 91-like isoform X1 [Tigriopus californicus]|uniref:zinc finger protein 91-like isoform X1 n=2 Tax=Tigriopus californicus TaxID=6832 RepID=UPI0027DA01FB|nr:zinc finger protein 91-like isoform X1 [Tigriopus californicus]